jgi:hypothetical protein
MPQLPQIPKAGLVYRPLSGSLLTAASYQRPAFAGERVKANGPEMTAHPNARSNLQQTYHLMNATPWAVTHALESRAARRTPQP